MMKPVLYRDNSLATYVNSNLAFLQNQGWKIVIENIKLVTLFIFIFIFKISTRNKVSIRFEKKTGFIMKSTSTVTQFPNATRNRVQFS